MTGVNSYNNYTPTSAIGNIHLYIILLMFFAFHLISRVVLRSFDQPSTYLLYIPMPTREKSGGGGGCTYQREEWRGSAPTREKSCAVGRYRMSRLIIFSTGSTRAGGMARAMSPNFCVNWREKARHCIHISTRCPRQSSVPVYIYRSHV